MTLRISHGLTLARPAGRPLAMPPSTDAVIEAVATVVATVAIDREADAPRELPKVAPQRTRAVEAYAQVQAGSRGFAVGRYLRVLA